MSEAILSGVTKPATPGRLLAEWTARFGPETFFVPLIAGTKRPQCAYANESIDLTRVGRFARLLREASGLAVYLGSASAGLCAIDFDAEADAAEFLALNPLLAGTLRTRGSRGCMVWVRIAGWFPRSVNPDHKHFEWRANRCLATCCGIHPKGHPYVILVDGPVVSTTFPEIAWPDAWALPWVDLPADAESEEQQRIADLEDRFKCKHIREKPDEKGGPPGAIIGTTVVGLHESYWAHRYAATFPIVFDLQEDRFYQYAADTGLWGVIYPPQIRETLSQWVLQDSTELGLDGTNPQDCQRNYREIVSKLQGHVSQRDPWSHRPPGNWRHLSNGVLHLLPDGTAELRPFDPSYLSRNQLPFAFDPAATCPRFETELLSERNVHPEDADLVEMLMGAIWLERNDAQRMFIFDGEGGTGKSQLSVILQGLAGEENTEQLRSDQINSRFETHRYAGKTLLASVDAPADFLSTKGAEGLKGLVGGDKFSTEKKGSVDTTRVRGFFNVIVTSNARLKVLLKGDLSAWRRRLAIVRYTGTKPAIAIPNFGDYLLTHEGSGLVNKSLRGAGRLRAALAAEGRLVLTERQQAVVDGLLAESDSVLEFVRQCVSPFDGAHISSADLPDAYAAFCADNDWEPEVDLVLRRKAAEYIMREHREARSNNIPGPGGKATRGWRNLQLVAADPG